MKVASSWTVLVAVACAVPVCAGELAFKGVPMGSPKSALFQTFVGISSQARLERRTCIADQGLAHFVVRP